ncbi:hypothetical protein IFM89_016262 [Coptis chinensis]|uniref:Pentatricopeptide repeat-containing protein n=1 Tax=Coptis chinensis TaxID=261450 RepID=A0A835LI65_9MAGN|nr:hypothetical protein IFM89_016262 [Coptis chinensis]
MGRGTGGGVSYLEREAWLFAFRNSDCFSLCGDGNKRREDFLLEWFWWVFECLVELIFNFLVSSSPIGPNPSPSSPNKDTGIITRFQRQYKPTFDFIPARKNHSPSLDGSCFSKSSPHFSTSTSSCFYLTSFTPSLQTKKQTLLTTYFKLVPLFTNANKSSKLETFHLGFYLRVLFQFTRSLIYSTTRNMPIESKSNILLWNSILRANVYNGHFENVLKICVEMRNLDFLPDGFSYPLIIRACGSLGSLELCKIVHCHVVVSGFGYNLHVGNEVVGMYGKLGCMELSVKVFDRMPSRTHISWNTVILGFSQNYDCEGAVKIYERMKLEGFEPTLVTWTSLSSAHARCGQHEKAMQFFVEMRRKGIGATAEAVAVGLSVCADVGAVSKEADLCDEAFELFSRLEKSAHSMMTPNVSQSPASYQYVPELAALNLGREIHGHVVTGSMDKNILVGNGLIHMYTKCGNLKIGRSVFDRINGKDLISWNSMITGFGLHGLGEDALTCFHEMIRARMKPDGITFVGVLSSCSHAGLVIEGKRLFDQMTSEYLITPQIEHYACMVDLLGRAGLLQEASEIVKMMPFEPDPYVSGALLNSCRMYKNTEVAEQTASHIFNLESNSTGSYMLLSNIYAANKRWEDSAKVRMLAKTKGLKKNPGWSWIEVKKKVYTFSAGSTLQQGLEQVHEILRDLCLRMEIEGYIPDKSFVLQDVGGEEKKQILYGHS